MTTAKMAIAEQKLKVCAIAKQIGLAPPTLSQIINGWATEATIRRWGPKIAEVIGKPVGQIFPEYEWPEAA